MPGYDSSDYNQMLWNTLMMGWKPPQQSAGGMPGAGGASATPTSGMPGPAGSTGMPATAQNPVTPWGQSAITGNPTVPGNGPGGGMLGTSPYTSINPNAAAGSQPPGSNPSQAPSAFDPSGFDPYSLQQAMAQYPQLVTRPGGVWDGGGGGAEG